MIATPGGERYFARIGPSGVETARERWRMRPDTWAGPWVATNADGRRVAVIWFDHLWRNGRIELEGATIEVRHRRGLRGGYDLVYEGTRLLSVRRGGGLRVVATLELAPYLPPYPRVCAVLVTASLFWGIADTSSG